MLFRSDLDHLLVGTWGPCDGLSGRSGLAPAVLSLLPLGAPVSRREARVLIKTGDETTDADLARSGEALEALLVSFFLFVRQRIAVALEESPTRAQRRAAAKAGTDPAELGDVLVVDLRRREARPTATDTGRTVSVQFPVRPHWRQQPCGKDRAERRLVLLPLHWKGPEGAPVRPMVDRLFNVKR